MTDRQAVVMLPGHLCTGALWRAQCENLADVADCLPLELDTGSSMAEIARSVLDRAPPRFALTGLSMGGHVAMEVMRQAPERVERLALIDTRAGVDSPERLAVRQRDEELVERDGLAALIRLCPDRWMSPAHAQDPRLRGLVESMAAQVGPKVWRQQLDALLSRIDSRPSLRAIRCPTLIMCGREDVANPLWMHEEMAALIPGARLEVIEDCGHLSPIEQPAVVSAALRRWLRW
ncbi:alpha/beta hydrolase [Pigmentiphaga soli]|uniref:Alpha/beta hydrolase n=1 Tax=Pigmentiphaga soli TaxID=1007095 RepID=A0ABP8H2W9_9BURK